jgi:hypothetical protein
MRDLKQDRNARVVVVGHAFVQNVGRGHYELAAEEPTNRRLAVLAGQLQRGSGSVGKRDLVAVGLKGELQDSAQCRVAVGEQ